MAVFKVPSGRASSAGTDSLSLPAMPVSDSSGELYPLLVANRIWSAVQSLGSENFDEREKASAQLFHLGRGSPREVRAALEGATTSDDLEVSRRAGTLLETLTKANAAIIDSGDDAPRTAIHRYSRLTTFTVNVGSRGLPLESYTLDPAEVRLKTGFRTLSGATGAGDAVSETRVKSISRAPEGGFLLNIQVEGSYRFAVDSLDLELPFRPIFSRGKDPVVLKTSLSNIRIGASGLERLP